MFRVKEGPPLEDLKSPVCSRHNHRHRSLKPCGCIQRIFVI